MVQSDDTIRRDPEALLADLAAAGATVKGRNSIRCPFHDDAHASSGIFQGEDGAWRFKCHGCGFHGDIHDVRAKAQGRPLADVLRDQWGERACPAGPPRQTTAQAGPAEPLRVYSLADLRAFAGVQGFYTYTDPDTGRVDLVAMRIGRPDGGKRFLQARPEGEGFVLKAPADPKPLYNRARVRAAGRVVVCEGEKCVHAFHDVGIVATTSPMGAGKAAHAGWGLLAGKTVYLWPDFDEPGLRHMADVADILEKLEPRPRIWRIDPAGLGLSVGGDVVDFLANMGDVTAEQRRAAVEAVLADAVGVGPGAELRELLEDTIAGRRRAIGWPWPVLGRLTKALLPATVTVVAGSPGACKSFFMLAAAAYWHRRGHKVAVYELEEGRPFHLARALAQAAGIAGLTDDEWVRANPGTTRDAEQEHRAFLEAFGGCLWADPAEQVTLPAVAEWIKGRVADGAELIVVDPVTAAATGQRPWDEDRDFLMAAKAAVGRTGARLLLTTHPRKGPANRNGAHGLDDLAGGASYSRFSQTVLWLERHLPAKALAVRTSLGTADFPEVNLTVFIAKARNASGAGLRLAYTFDGTTLGFGEHGIVAKE